ncbi:filamentous hemagglutinin N-terminal domain-containing protein, partial [Salmonella enterica subsp. enterica]|nr:filamentous hemagglutinin N-terminal domain-containing protein [Salmonella enterica subsp. enterica]
MNKIYKLKYDRRRNRVVAVSELTAGAGKESTGQVAALAGLTDMCSFRKLLGTLTPLAFLTGLVMSLLPGIALANPDLPTGGQIVAGQGSINTNGNQMTISQNTHGLVTNWNTFDVGQNHTVQFVQPDSSAVALNRVTGGHESQILGTLTANGQVMLVNPAGVMFGKGATVNTAGLVASTKNISNADFMAGHYTFSGGSDTGAEVVNQGSLTTTEGGFIVLAADRVKNSGNIRTPGGKTVLAAGDKVTLQLDNTGLASVSVSGSVVNALVENSGLLSATDGRVYLTARGKDMLLNTVVNNTGTVEASGLSGHGGEIVLNGGDSGVVSQSGTLLADSKTGHGGKITVEGQNIHMTANSRTSATGKTGGGEVYVGGGWQGKDSHIKNASQVVMSQGATIDVSATESGNGGRAVLWSDDYTNFRGDILAKGGSRSGHGGQVETSSHGNLQAFGDVDASAVAGQGGNWLLDPLDVTIVGGNTDSGITESGKGTGTTLDTDTDHIFSPQATGAQVSAQKIADQLNAGTDVTVETHAEGAEKGTITLALNASIKKDGGGDATLTLKADKDISIEAGAWKDKYTSDMGKIVATSGKLNLKLLTGSGGQDGAIKLDKFVHIKLNGGDFYAGPGSDSGNTSMFFKNNDSISAGNINLNTLGGTTFQFSALNADKDLTIKGPLSVTAQYNLNTNLKAGGMVDIAADNSDISFDASTTTGGNEGGHILIDGKEGVSIQTKGGHLKMNVVGKTQNDMTIRSDNGSVTLAGKVQDGTDGLLLTNINITSKGNTDIEGLTHYGKAAVLSGVDINAGGNVTIKGTAYRYDLSRPGSAMNTEGVTLSGSHITSGGDVSLTGFSASKGKSSLQVIGKSNITANSGTISLNGTTEGNNNKPGGIDGVKVDDSTLSAASLNVKGVAKTQGTGFSLTNTTLENGLENLGNVTFSSAGSSAGVTNLLDSSIVNEANRDTLLAKNIENMTSIDMNGNAIFNDSSKGWIAGVTSSSTSNGVWTFDNTSVNAGGDVSLNGVGFTNSTIGVSGGDFRLMNAGPVKLDGDTITSNGSVDIHSLAGYVGVVRTNISAKDDINLTAGNGTLTIQGANASSVVNITSVQGNITIDASRTDKKNNNVTALFSNANFSAAENIKVSVSGYNVNSEGYNAVMSLQGANHFKAKNTDISVINKFITPEKGWKSTGQGISFKVWSDTYFEGNTKLNVTADTGVVFESRGSESVTHNIHVINGSLDLFATSLATYNSLGVPSGGVVIANYYDANRVNFYLSDANVNISASATDKTGRVAGFAAAPADGDSASHRNAFQFSGMGNVSVKGQSVNADGVDLRDFSNQGLTGRMTVEGTSVNGTGVHIDGLKGINAVLTNATVTGKSTNGAGILVNVPLGGSTMDLNGNTITGTSDTSTGININGNNVTITNGSLNGTSSGSAAGVSLTGGSHYTLSGSNVTGQSVNGTGVAVSGNLSVNDNAVLNGTASGTGNGVSVTGNLQSEGGVTISGNATSGSGVVVSGNTALSNATVSGNSTSGSGVNISGQLTADGHTVLNGASYSGVGLQLRDAGITSTVLNGNSTSGSGMVFTGNVSLDEATVQTLNATSVDGTGLNITDSKVVVSTGSSTPVTTPAVLTGTSQTGSGVATSGNVSITGIVLKGSSDSDSGVGVTLGGNLTVADAISGVNASATDHGTALVMDDVMVSADDYISTGKNFVINASASGSGVTAIKTQGSSHLDDVILNGTVSHGGTAVELGGQVSGGHITGTSDTGYAVVVSDKANVDRTDVKGRSDSGIGLQI